MTLELNAADDRSEPKAEVFEFRCVRSQHENRCNRKVAIAAMRRRNRPFEMRTAQLVRAIYKLTLGECVRWGEMEG